MVDFSQLLGGGAPDGLLTPQQSGNVNQDTLLAIAAGLMKAGGPSPYKPGMTTLSGIGEALQGGLAARRQSQQDALTQTLMRAKTLESLSPLLKTQADYQSLGIPLPPNYQRIIDSLSNLVAPGGARSGAAPGAVPGAAGVPTAGATGTAPGAAPAPATGLATRADPKSPTFLRDLAQELGLPPTAALPNYPGNAVLMKAAEERIHATDPTLEAAQRRTKILEGDVERDKKAYPAFVGLGQIGRESQRDTQLSSALVESPNFASGFGNEWELFKKRFQAYFNPNDPASASAPYAMEVFRKITASNINTQIEQLKAMQSEMGPGAGRIFQSQINLYEKASQSLDNSPASNRFLADLQRRSAEQNIAISNMAIDYKLKHGIIDAGFDKELSTYLDKNPLYTSEEYKDLGKIARGKPKEELSAGAGAPPPPPGAVERRVNPKDPTQFVYFDAQGKPILSQSAPGPMPARPQVPLSGPTGFPMGAP